MRTLVTADTHGNYLGFVDTLKRCNFDYKVDRLIVLGDIADGMPDTKSVIDELLKIKNLIFIIGNHDVWCHDYMLTLEMPNIWIKQGGANTVLSYLDDNGKVNIPDSHKQFLASGLPYYKDEQDNYFVHGGIPFNYDLENVRLDYFTWDRELYNLAKKEALLDFKYPVNKVFIGHTDVGPPYIPFISEKVINIDTGAGWAGKVTIMDVATLEYWQSEPVIHYYPKEVLRR